MSADVEPAKVTITCDRCGESIQVDQQNPLVLDLEHHTSLGWLSLHASGHERYDLCVICADSFHDFLEHLDK